MRCAEPVVIDLPQGVFCAACQASPPPFDVTVAPLRYEFPVDAGIKALKFGRRLYYAQAFGELLVAEMQRHALQVDAFLPVPLHWRRQAMRGFNQAAEIGRPVASHYSIPVLAGVVRHRATPFQSALPASERSTNLRDAFVVKRKLTGQHVLIVDDVVTSGATARHLANALLDAGAAKVSVLAVARASRISRQRQD
jgi:ComF family protein